LANGLINLQKLAYFLCILPAAVMAWNDEKSHYGSHAQMKKSIQEKEAAKDIKVADNDEHLYFFPVSSLPLSS
jgi:hypothetical protein